MFIFVFQLPFIDFILSKIVGSDQLWTVFQQKLVTANRKLVFFKTSNFCLFTVQNCHYFYCAISPSLVNKKTNEFQCTLEYRSNFVINIRLYGWLFNREKKAIFNMISFKPWEMRDSAYIRKWFICNHIVKFLTRWCNRLTWCYISGIRGLKGDLFHSLRRL